MCVLYAACACRSDAVEALYKPTPPVKAPRARALRPQPDPEAWDRHWDEFVPRYHQSAMKDRRRLAQHRAAMRNSRASLSASTTSLPHIPVAAPTLAQVATVVAAAGAQLSQPQPIGTALL